MSIRIGIERAGHLCAGDVCMFGLGSVCNVLQRLLFLSIVVATKQESPIPAGRHHPEHWPGSDGFPCTGCDPYLSSTCYQYPYKRCPSICRASVFPTWLGTQACLGASIPATTMPIPDPTPFHGWLRENRHSLQPPVNNFCLHTGNDFILMIVGGPNARNDFHVNETEVRTFQGSFPI